MKEQAKDLINGANVECFLHGPKIICEKLKVSLFKTKAPVFL
jgi:hypothetical protein